MNEIPVSLICGNCGCTVVCMVKTSSMCGVSVTCCNCSAIVMASCVCDSYGRVRIYNVRTVGGLTGRKR